MKKENILVKWIGLIKIPPLLLTHPAGNLGGGSTHPQQFRERMRRHGKCKKKIRTMILEQL
jgi:hypothetical protein